MVRIAPGIRADALGLEVRVIDAEGRAVVPGYVDQHVHVIGGGGESGPYSRTPELQLDGIIAAGVTTLVGVLGTDGTSRTHEALLAKVRGLEQEGVSAWMLTGSYELPLRTLTGDARRDIILIDKVLGIGEIAVSDHRSSQPTLDELKRVVTQARVGGMLAGKAGPVQFHMGTGRAGLDMLFRILEETEIPGRHLIPTHVNRSEALFTQGMEFVRRGGCIDLTSGVRAADGFTGCVEPREAVLRCWQAGLDMTRVTMSSDGNGCMSVPLPGGGAKLLVARLHSLHEETMGAVALGVPMETVLRVSGENPARANGLWPRKGCLLPDSDADLLILNENRSIDTVICRGRVMVRGGRAVVHGTFEE